MIADGALGFVDEEWVLAEVVALATSRNLGLGELECLAYAIRDSDALVCCDDFRARTIIAREIGEGRVTGSMGLLRQCVLAGVLSAAEAFDCYHRMRAAGAYLPEVPSSYFGDHAEPQV